MVDAQHGHDALLVVDAVQNSIRAAASAVNAGKLVAQLPPDAMWVIDQCASDEVDDGCSDDFR